MMEMGKEATPIPKHCGVPMTITGFRMYCKGCGYEEKYTPKSWHKKAQGLTEAPKHCGVEMSFSRHIQCSGCGYEEDQELLWG